MYAGTFLRHHRESDEYGTEYWIALNESGEDFYEVLRKRTQKYVIITSPDTNVVSGIDEDGAFSFPYPYKVYFLDEVPDDIKVGEFIYDGSSFRPYIDVAAWKYNMNLRIKDEMVESLMKGEQRPDLEEKRKAVDAYEGDGYNPPLPF